jgi:hypothetical protein
LFVTDFLHPIDHLAVERFLNKTDNNLGPAEIGGCSIANTMAQPGSRHSRQPQHHHITGWR